MALGKSLILDHLPDDVKERVVWRDRYWLTDEALSTYRRSAGLFGLEMHSPIVCIGQGIPAIVCRFYEQTSKGIMWKDIGLGDWLFDMDNPGDVERIVPTVLSVAMNQDAARKKALEAKSFVQKRQKRDNGYSEELPGKDLIDIVYSLEARRQNPKMCEPAGFVAPAAVGLVRQQSQQVGFLGGFSLLLFFCRPKESKKLLFEKISQY